MYYRGIRSEKSSLINQTLSPISSFILNSKVKEIKCDGLDYLDNQLILINSIGRTPRSNPATYTGLFYIRDLLSQTVEARSRAIN